MREGRKVKGKEGLTKRRGENKRGTKEGKKRGRLHVGRAGKGVEGTGGTDEEKGREEEGNEGRKKKMQGEMKEGRKERINERKGEE